MSKRLSIVILFLLAFLVGSCTQTVSTQEEDRGGDPSEEAGSPDAPDSLVLDEETGENSAEGGDPDHTASDKPQIPEGATTIQPALFPTDWTLASPFPICPNTELTLSGISYLENGQLMVSFIDPNAGQELSQGDAPAPPIFLELADDEGEQLASYDCTKHPSAPGLVYCFGDPIPAGAQVKASLAVGDRESVIIYDPTSLVGEAGAAEPGLFLAGRSDLNDELLFPAVFGPNSEYLAGIWGTDGTSLDPAIEFIFASQAAEGLGYSGEVKTLIGLFNILSACQIAADQGWPMPEGCQELGSAYYQPQTDCQGFPDCYQACAGALLLPSPDGETSLGKKELLDYLEGMDPDLIPAPCLDYQYWSQGVLFYGSSDGEDGSDSGGIFDSVLSPLETSCLLDPENPICTGEFWNEGSDEESEVVFSEFPPSAVLVTCALSPFNAYCEEDFPDGDTSGEIIILNLCASEIGWVGGITTYGEAADLLTYLLSAGASIPQEALPAGCQTALEQTGSAFYGLGGIISGVVYSGTINSCVYQATMIIPSESQAGGSGGGQSGGGSGSSKPSCGPGLIAVLWQGEWICIPEN